MSDWTNIGLMREWPTPESPHVERSSMLGAMRGHKLLVSAGLGAALVLVVITLIALRATSTTNAYVLVAPPGWPRLPTKIALESTTWRMSDPSPLTGS